MALSVKYRYIEIRDEDQVNPVNFIIHASVHTTQADVVTAKGTDEIDRITIKCQGTRANVAALMATLTIKNAAEIDPDVLALLTPPLNP